MKYKRFLGAATVALLIVIAATTVATAQIYTDLYNFDGISGGNPAYPALLAQGRDGNLYGTTFGGGDGGGVVFKITPSGELKVLYKFEPRYGLGPRGGLTLGRDGNLYGTTTSGGGVNLAGTIFKITPSGLLTTLYNFTGGTDGSHPNTPPIQGADGNFYGTAFGVAYKITPSGSFTQLASLPVQESTDSPLLQASDGSFYGTTYRGGSSGDGTVFKITPKGILTIVYNFDGTHGSNPDSLLIQGSDGNFYGTTSQGGSNVGVVFKLTPRGALTVRHNFPDPNYPHDGFWPSAGLARASDGNFYGVTVYGGTVSYGVIFKITPSAAYTILYNFDANGVNPESTPMQHTNGKIYGLTNFGGTHSFGVVYSFDVGLRPFVSLLPYSGKIGKTIEFLGQGFTGTTGVSFNGTAAPFTVKSGTYLTATVPNGATTGFVTVTTPRGTLKSNKKFWVKP